MGDIDGRGVHEFPFEEGDTVLVRVREAGRIVVKFEAECSGITTPESAVSSPKARFELPFGVLNSVTVRPYEAEFEVVDDAV